MKIKFLGGAGEVTGSAHLISTDSFRVLRDCGMFQGRRSEAFGKNLSMFQRSGGIHAVVISHAHIDHCGNFPTMVRQGFSGNVYCTEATADLLPVMWMDSARIQENDIKFMIKNGIDLKDLHEPLYEIEDVPLAEKCIRPVKYDVPVPVTPDMDVEFIEAGHILGSALNRMTVREKGKETRIGFAFDLGRKNMPVLKDPEQLKDLDILVIESTYGNRVHEPLDQLQERLADVLKRTFDRGGKVIIPSFSLGRTQEMQYVLKKLFDSGLLPQVPVYVDSPLSQHVSEVFTKHGELFDKETTDMGSGFLKQGFIHYVSSKEESQRLNTSKEPCIIISASGMCESGRILHHLIHNAPSRKNTILFVGFLAQHTLGRKILEGQSPVFVYGRPLQVNAEVVKLNAFSAHAGRDDLLEYIKACPGLKKLVLVHGEQSQLQGLAEGAKEITSAEIIIPSYDEEIDFG